MFSIFFSLIRALSLWSTSANLIRVSLLSIYDDNCPLCMMHCHSTFIHQKKFFEKGPSVHDIDINQNQLMSKLPCEVNDCNKPYLLFYMPYVRCILIGYLNLIYGYLKPLTVDTLSNCLRGRSFGVFKKERDYSKMYTSNLYNVKLLFSCLFKCLLF